MLAAVVLALTDKNLSQTLIHLGFIIFFKCYTSDIYARLEAGRALVVIPVTYCLKA